MRKIILGILMVAVLAMPSIPTDTFAHETGAAHPHCARFDANCDGKVRIGDLFFWIRSWFGPQSQQIAVSDPDAPDTAMMGEDAPLSAFTEDITVCDPANGPFSTTIDNEYFPLPLGHFLALEDSGERVEITVLDEIEIVAGVETRVVEEREWASDELTEVSRNFFVQAPDGTVCYYGEDVDDYTNGAISGHGGAWRAGMGENKPGIIMPAQPAVGQIYQQEIAPGVAEDAAEHIAFEESFETAAGVFNDVLLVDETPSSTKRYAPGVGLIYDDGLELVDY